MGVDSSHVGSYVGGYKIKAHLGEGRLGMVFRARAQNELTAQAQGGDVIFRALRPALCDRSEFRANFNVTLPLVAMLDHPSIVRHIDALELPDGQLVVIEEFVEGTPLSHIMGHGAPMPWSRALTIIEPLLGALAHAKAREVVHGAVNPSNVLIRAKDEQVMLLDFGVGASELGPGLPFMAPELLPIGPSATISSVRPASPSTELSDVYSVGMLLYVMLTGSFPWGATSKNRDIVAAKLRGGFQRADILNPALPPALGAVVEAACKLDPTKRIQSVTELSRALTQAVEPAIGQWIRPGRTITREKQFVAQRLEEALARRGEPRTRSAASLRAVDAVPASSHELEAIHTGDADPREVARIAHAREAWSRRSTRSVARNWAYVLSALAGPFVVALIGLLNAFGIVVPAPEDWVVFVLPALAFYFLGGWFGLKAGLRRFARTDMSLFPRAIVSPLISLLVLFGGDWLLDITNLGGGLDSGPRTAAILGAIWSANGVFGCWTANRLNRLVEQIKVEERLPPPAASATGRHRVV